MGVKRREQSAEGNPVKPLVLARVPLYSVRTGGPTVKRMADCLSYRPDELVWCAEWATGKRIDVAAKDLKPVAASLQPSFEECWERALEWGKAGEAHALWWLGWWLGGTEHCRATWFNIAALRRDPVTHGWALDRIVIGASSACMCPGHPPPSLVPVQEIPELNNGPIGSDWVAAVRAALTAVDEPVAATQVDEMLSNMASGLDESAAAWRAGVPTSNLQHHSRWPEIEHARRSRWEEVPPFP